MVATEEAFYRALVRGKAQGELTGVRDPRAVARFLSSSLQGLVLMTKAAPGRKTLEDVVNITLSVVH
jgi:TetR/AcrR family transcriptional repressor of nem operon